MTKIHKGNRRAICVVKGNCMEDLGLSLPHGGYAITDNSITPAVGDIIYCNDERGAIGGFIKQIKSFDGDSVIVGTSYKDSSRDFSFVASEIYGVVVEVYCRATKNQIYKKATKDSKAGESQLRKEDEGKCQK